MSASLLKLYSLLIIVAVLFSATFLHGKKTAISPSKKIEIQETKKITSNSATTEIVASTTNIATEPEKNNTPTIATTTITEAKITPRDTTPHTEEIDVPLERNFSANRPSDICKETVTYKIGRFDDGFDISKSYFLETLNHASTLWNDAMGKTMLAYNDQGVITVNLIYDRRQQDTKNNQLLTAEIKNTEDAALLQKKEYEDIEKTFTTMKEDYVSKVTTFNTDQKTYNDTVQDWNNKGGAPQADYDKLMLEKDRLQKLNESLLATQNQLNEMLKEINKRITRYNELVLYANDNVSLNNKIARKKFTEGQYIPQTNEINIYQFTDDIKLERVLAHEFGHALGIDHNKNKESIMYAVNSATTKMLSKEDVRDLKALCAQN